MYKHLKKIEFYQNPKLENIHVPVYKITLRSQIRTGRLCARISFGQNKKLLKQGIGTFIPEIEDGIYNRGHGLHIFPGEWKRFIKTIKGGKNNEKRNK